MDYATTGEVRFPQKTPQHCKMCAGENCSLEEILIKGEFSEQEIISDDRICFPCFLKCLGIRIFRDGDKVCVLQGEDLQEGKAGFGDTLYKALQDFLLFSVSKPR